MRRPKAGNNAGRTGFRDRRRGQEQQRQWKGAEVDGTGEASSSGGVLGEVSTWTTTTARATSRA